MRPNRKYCIQSAIDRAEDGIGVADLPPVLRDKLMRARGLFLDAMPLAAAVMIRTGGDAPELGASNRLYRALDAADPAGKGRGIVARSGLGARLEAFLAGEDDTQMFDWIDGDEVVGRQFEVRLSRLHVLDAPAPRGLITLIDRTSERQAHKTLRLEMLHDALTGLPNRAGFNERIEALIDEGDGQADHAVLIVDVRRFSRINESIGPIAGDELLITVARRLMAVLRAGDVIARTGGNEFGLLIRLTNGIADAEHVARRIAGIFADPCRLSELEISIDCAVGGALFDPRCDLAETVRRAQFAVKAAKASGRFEVYHSSASNLAAHRFALETELRRAIEQDALTLAFQPLIDLVTGAVSGFEALARWQVDGRDVPPGEFIPVAEESGLIRPLGRWALDSALRTLADWDRRAGAPLPISMAVNISPIQIASDNVAAAVAASLVAHGIGGERLVLELTESAIIADPDRAAQTLGSLKNLEATIAMDDFGTGFSNLALLQRLPIDILKIDRSFVTDMLVDRDKSAIVRAILSLAQALGMETIAEGIETLELSQLVGALGCTRGQGYYYARALDADEAWAYWRERPSARRPGPAIPPSA
ncbi:putative bifunctional diguanylate cyclase/phosphodiesterase [Sphingomonas flavalba]|uniref:putative bifunctional diguanylate cyclase/phosphodiesterase n=1 Tax=Sphingomonas flavalba TaxID=2559804 RepID=UPI001EF08DCB|nr:bifunctional diguanylate cyclase/phosphodiesterase [Sphingomonas flavalba]